MNFEGKKEGSRVGAFMGKLLISIVPTAFIVVASLLLNSSYKKLIEQNDRVTNWKKVTAVITASQVIYPKGSQESYRCELSYDYRFNGQSFHYRQNKEDAASGDFKWTQSVKAKYPMGAIIDCFVNPNSPVQSTLKMQRASYLTAAFVVPLVFLVIGSFILLLIWLPSRKKVAVNQEKLEKREFKHSQIMGAVFFLIFGVIGAFTLYKAMMSYIQFSASDSWQQTPCLILSSRIESHESRDNKGRSSTTYQVDIVYRYSYKGKSYESNTFNFDSGSSSNYGKYRSILKQYPIKSQQTCYVNPEQPSKSVLRRELGTGFYVLLAVGLVFSLVELLGLYLLFIYKPKSKTNVEIVVGKFPLKPFQSRGQRLIFKTIMAIIWNVFTGGIFYVSYDSLDLFLIIFLSVFSFAGLFIIYDLIKEFMRIGSASLVMDINQSAFKLGDTVTIHWDAIKAQQIKGLIFSLQAVKSLNRQANSGALNDPIYVDERRVSSHSEILAGRLNFELPKVLETTSSQVTWVLKLTILGKYKVVESYRILVYPS